MLRTMSVLLMLFIFIFSCSTNPEDDGVNIKKPGVIKIGYMNDANETSGLARLNALATNETLLNSLNVVEFSVTEIASDISPDSLDSYSIIYLPPSWAAEGLDVYDNINAKADALLDYINRGGGLYIDQPNPYNRPGGVITIDFLPYPITLRSSYANEEVVAVDSTHYITNGLDPVDLPFPADQITDMPDQYDVLVVGASTGYPSLFVTDYGDGKILGNFGHPSKNAIHPFSDEVYVRMLMWLTLD